MITEAFDELDIHDHLQLKRNVTNYFRFVRFEQNYIGIKNRKKTKGIKNHRINKHNQSWNEIIENAVCFM